MNDAYKGTQRPESGASQFNAMSYLIEQIINRVATTTLVKVIRVTNSGGVSPVGFVDVQPMVHQLDGNGGIMPHGIIHHIPYFRLQGGTDAIILDPKDGDIGICVFAHNDISGVKASGKAAAPGSFRRYDMADGLYIGGVLNGTPAQYLAFTASGIMAVSPSKITCQAPTVEMDASSEFIVSSGNIQLQGPVTMTQGASVSGDLTAAGKSVSTHTHTDPQGGTTSEPN
jgi:hypothetical protein